MKMTSKHENLHVWEFDSFLFINIVSKTNNLLNEWIKGECMDK